MSIELIEINYPNKFAIFNIDNKKRKYFIHCVYDYKVIDIYRCRPYKFNLFKPKLDRFDETYNYYLNMDFEDYIEGYENDFPIGHDGPEKVIYIADKDDGEIIFFDGIKDHFDSLRVLNILKGC